MSKIKVEEMSCYDEVVRVLGVTQAKIELWKVVNYDDYQPLNCGSPFTKLDGDFDWHLTPQGYYYWEDINDKIVEKTRWTITISH